MADATSPAAPTITEPSESRRPHPADVHMEATGFSDADGDTHRCTDWGIWAAASGKRVWSAPCSGGVLKVHTHLGDGTFEGPLAGETQLEFGAGYELRVRFEDSAGEQGPDSVRAFTTAAAGPPGQAGADPWAVRQAGYKVEVVAGGLQLPVHIAPVPGPGTDPDDPLLYVAELYGNIKVVTRDGTVREYAHGLLNFSPTGNFPGSGEKGLAGVAVDPDSGDVFATAVYEDTDSPADPKPHYAKVMRFHSVDGGLTADSQETILDIEGEEQGPSHQISNVTIGPDGMLYVQNGDGFYSDAAQDLDDFRGKILRMTPDGDPVPSNPFYDPADSGSDGLPDPRDYVYAYGLRNPFGGAWRASDGKLYEVENGPSVDRLARVEPGRNFGWNGTDRSMLNFALYTWFPAHAPLAIAFVQPQTFSGSGFPAAKMDHAFVSESGFTYASGPQVTGKRIVEFAPQGDGFADPAPLVEYVGTGKATVAGLAAGPGGLYFTDLYKDHGAASAIEPGARLLRVRSAPPKTKITKGPPRKLRTAQRRRQHRFKFTSRVGASFECKLDKRKFKPCTSPYRRKLRAPSKRFKKHTFKVRASDEHGTDPTPAKHKWRLKRRP